MKIVVRLLGFLLLVLVAVGVFFVNAWYFKPWSASVFFERVFIERALYEPELLTRLRILEGLGIHGHNARVSDESPAADARWQAWERETLDTLHRYQRADLDPAQQLSYDVADWYFADMVEGQRWQLHNYIVSQLDGPQSGLPNLMTTIQQINDETDARDYVARLNQFRYKFDGVLENLKLREAKGLLPPRFVIDKTLVQMQTFIEAKPEEHLLYQNLAKKLDAIGTLPGSQRAELLGQARNAIETVVYPAYRELIAYFLTLQGKVSENYGVWKLPEGDQFYAYMVRHHTTSDLTPEDVHQLGLTEVARIEREMDAILTGEGLVEGSVGARIRQLNEKPELGYPNTDEGRKQVLADYQAIIDEVSQGLGPYFNKRPKVGVEVQRVPEFKEKDAAGAYYQSPPLDGSRPGVFFANLRDLREVQKFHERTLAYHEAIPGHHFQIALAQEMKGVPIFRKVLHFTAYSEGWALYAERLAWELGFEKEPLDNLGRLQAEMHRAVRLVVDSGMHYKRWTREQAIEYMVDKTGIAQGGVVAEIERYLVWPGQALAYKVGMLKILDLRERAKRELGSQFDIRAFHDVVLGSGALPLAVLEQQVDRWIAQTKSGGSPG